MNESDIQKLFADPLDFTPPPVDFLVQATALWRAWFAPRYFGMDNIDPARPLMFVPNHTVYAIMDIPLYVVEIYRQKGIFPRGMADFYHFAVPFWRVMVKHFGGVRGTRENCAKLMEAGQSILVYPGGGREVCKRKGEAYKLIWKNRTGFVRLAMEHGYDIIPTASVGPDNAYSILLDAGNFTYSVFGKAFKAMGLFKTLLRDGEAVPPVVRGIGPTFLPRPEKTYISFGKPISCAPYAGKQDDKDVRMAVRGQVEEAINGQIRELLLFRERDTDQALWRRILNRL